MTIYNITLVCDFHRFNDGRKRILCYGVPDGSYLESVKYTTYTSLLDALNITTDDNKLTNINDNVNILTIPKYTIEDSISYNTTEQINEHVWTINLQLTTHVNILDKIDEIFNAYTGYGKLGTLYWKITDILIFCPEKTIFSSDKKTDNTIIDKIMNMLSSNTYSLLK